MSFHWVFYALCMIGFTTTTRFAKSTTITTTTSTSNRRRLEDFNNNGDDTFEYNVLSDYSIRFVKCQHVKMYDDELAEEEDLDTVLSTKHFVLYKLCPSSTSNDDDDDGYMSRSSSSTSTTCPIQVCSDDTKHGEYIIELQDYLEQTTEFKEAELQNMCNNCNEQQQQCNNDDDGCNNSNGCGQICYEMENLENNGYVDASEYIECQELNVERDDDDDDWNDDDNGLYIGPKCSSDGQSIQIGLFSDENCYDPYEGDEDVEDLLGAKLSYHLFASTTYDADSGDNVSACLSCKEQEDGNNNNNNNDQDDVNEMCEELYAASAKCESIHGLKGGFVNQNRQDQDYENQIETEFMVCTFMESLLLNSYTESGEINIWDPQDEILRETTTLQIIVLSSLAITILGLILYAYFLSKQIKDSFPPSLIAKSTNQLT